ncbi:MAG: hypothetical protein ACK526_09910 [Planctomyces sp.]
MKSDILTKRSLTLLVVEETPHLAPAISLELRHRVSSLLNEERSGSPTGRSRRLPDFDFPDNSTDIQREAVVRRELLQTVCRNVEPKDFSTSLKEHEVSAVILDLRRYPRESLVILRKLLSHHSPPQIAATGPTEMNEILSVLMEAGCSHLQTDYPMDIPLAQWYERVVRRYLRVSQLGE